MPEMIKKKIDLSGRVWSNKGKIPILDMMDLPDFLFIDPDLM